LAKKKAEQEKATEERFAEEDARALEAGKIA
jgi:hypothetical protein